MRALFYDMFFTIINIRNLLSYKFSEKKTLLLHASLHLFICNIMNKRVYQIYREQQC